MPEAVIVDALRTPIGKRGGALAGWHPTDLLGHVLKAAVERNGIDPATVDDVIGGCVTQRGEQSTNVIRNAWIAGGLPWSVPATTIDRQCGSSQQAVHFAAQGVMAGAYDLVIACGVESMSRVPMASAARGGLGPFSGQFMSAIDNQLKLQFEVAQKIANDHSITRSEMDEFAMESHRRASAASRSGAFDREILPTPIRDADGEETGAIMTVDEGIRHETSPEKMASLTSAHFQPELAPDITAGNSSPTNDGAAAVVIASRETADRLGLRPRATFRNFAVGADDAVWMLTAPNPVTRRLFDRSGLSVGDLDAIEINEAFASIAMAWAREFSPDPSRLNSRGGAIALGHPLGASGVRIMTTLLHILEDTGGRLGLQAMCEGGGQANVTVIERL